MEEKKSRNDEIEEEQDDIEEIDEVYSHMLEKSNRDKKDDDEEEIPGSSDDIQEEISDRDFYDDASYSPSKVTDWQGPTHTQYDFFVFLPHRVLCIAQDEYFSWLTLFYALPKEIVQKRPKYLDIPRNVYKLLNSKEHMELILSDVFEELVWDSYAWGIWQAFNVPMGKDGKKEYKPIPGNWQNYSGNFPLWRLSYELIRYFRQSFEGEMELSFQRLFCMPPDFELPWFTYRQWSNLIFNLTDRIIEQRNLQPFIDEVWMNRQPEDYADGENIRKRDFMRAWNHSRNHPHFTIEQMEKDGIQIASSDAVEQEVTGELDVEQFKSKLSDTDKKILEMRVEGYGLEEIAKATGYKTASAVYKHILKITRAYEDFSNPMPDEDGTRVSETD